MEVTELGMVMLVRDLQLANAYVPMVVTELGMVILLSEHYRMLFLQWMIPNQESRTNLLFYRKDKQKKSEDPC